MREVFSVEIEGVKPYLMCAFKGDEGQDKKKKKGANPTKEQDCENALYRKPDKTIYVPSTQIEATMREGGRDLKFGRMGNYANIINAGISVEPFELPITPQTFSQFIAAVRIPPRTGARVMKGRPRFENWSLSFQIANTDERLHEATLKEILTNAGQFKGIGDWRPKFGLFQIKSWKKEA